MTIIVCLREVEEIKNKIVLFSVLGLALLLILALSFLQEPDEYKGYEEGITIVVNNLSGSNIESLNFSYGFAEDPHYKEIDIIENLIPGDTSTIKIKKAKELKSETRDTSIYMNYKLLSDFEVNENLIYFTPPQPDKIVVIIDIEQIDSDGNVKYNIKGFDGARSF
ncbi:hypothetical protein [Psychrobacillus sp.]|uniref:hypothetical protein n=1 Tax=Psychrobacillus sp. TaxID=1871623 RepID=UPI0028BE6D6F|nr:hypothetical protein [Psychrobacillus sp.]